MVEKLFKGKERIMAFMEEYSREYRIDAIGENV